MPGSYRIYPDGNYLYFITSTVVEWIPLFLSYPYCQILLDSFTFCRQSKGLRLHAYVIMPTHLHAIISCDQPDRLTGIVRDMKRHTSRRISRKLVEDRSRVLLRPLFEMAPMGKGNTEYKVWQDGYHPIAIYTQKFFRQKLEYLHDNPVRKGFVRRSEEWQYSSADEYINGRLGLIEIDRLVV
jgi:putative transposase